MAASHVSIPRFLLPQAGPVWPRVNLGNRHLRTLKPLVVRYASLSNAAKGNRSPNEPRPKSKPKARVMVLEKPETFNPPSHGARLPNKARQQQYQQQQQQHYGGSLSADELAAQRTREYPGMPPPRGTWAHWFWTSRALHMTITMVSFQLQDQVCGGGGEWRGG